jgi:hypothetical protein
VGTNQHDAIPELRSVSNAGTAAGETHRWPQWTLVAVVVGVVLRVWQFASDPSIWLDEAAVVRNVLDRHPSQLLAPLDYAQVAPPGFLLGTKLAVALFGLSEYVLRIIPLVAGIASLLLFVVLARSVLRPFGVFVATLMFSLATPLIYFASNVKQYSSDVAIALAALALALYVLRSTLTTRTALGLALAAIPLLALSEAAVFPFIVAGGIILIDGMARRRSDKWLRTAVVAAWAAAVVGAFLYARTTMTMADRAYLHQFWSYAFMPHTGTTAWLWTMARRVVAGPPVPDAFDGSLHYPWPAVFIALVPVGFIAIAIRSPAKGALVAGPVFLSLAAAWHQSYPFGTRVSLYLLPLYIAAAVAAAEFLGEFLARRKAGAYASVLLIPGALMALRGRTPPQTRQHLRPVLQHLAAHEKPGDAVWVYYGAGLAFNYYARLIHVSGDVRVGDCAGPDRRDYLRQVDAERGRARVWVVMAHTGPSRFDERRMIVAYLDSIGHRLDEFHAPPQDTTVDRAQLYLFDLSDAERLTHGSAERFAVSDESPPGLSQCYGTLSPNGPGPGVIKALVGSSAR